MTQINNRIPLLGTVLILACALSGSTACITATVIEAHTAHSELRAAQNADAALAQARLIHSGQTATPTVTADPRSIEAALLPALPTGRNGNREQFYKNVAVTLQPKDTAGISVYLITAYGDFTPEYARAFAKYSRTLRAQLPGKNHFIIEVHSGTPGGSTLIFRQYD